MRQVLEDRDFFDGTGGGVTFSGGEPLLQADFLFDCADRLAAEGVHVAVETALGYERLPQPNPCKDDVAEHVEIRRCVRKKQIELACIADGNERAGRRPHIRNGALQRRAEVGKGR